MTKVEDFNLLDKRVKDSLFAKQKNGSFDPVITDMSAYETELANFNFAYATGTTTSDGMNWTSVINTPASGNGAYDPANTALFDLGTKRQFDLIWGTSICDGNNTRGWNISLAAKTTVGGETPVPEIDGPVLVQVGFALAGLYVLMLGLRRRRQDDVGMS